MLKRIFLLCIVFIFTDVSFANTKYHSVEEFVSAQKLIRIYADNSPEHGNQAASASLISRLRQLGFKGEFEFVYGNRTTEKITNLFNLPRDIPEDYYDSERKIRFLKLKAHLSRVLNHTIEVVPLGMKGGSDYDTNECANAKADGIKLPSTYCDDMANYMATQVFIVYEPYVPGDETIFYYYELNVDHDHDDFPRQKGSDKQYFVLPVTNWSQAKDYLEHTAQGQKILAEKAALKTFIQGVEDHRFNVLPVYGFTIKDMTCGVHAPGCFPGNILQIITAARHAQLNGPKALQKPLVIPVFYNYEKEAGHLARIIKEDQWGQYEKPGSEEARKAIKRLSLPTVFSTADIKDTSTIDRLLLLKPGEILLLSVGALPKEVFDGIYNHTDTNVLPAIREGANTFNSLVLTGRPHIRCEPWWEVGFDLIKDTALKNELKDNVYTAFITKNGICKGMNTWQYHTNFYQSLGNLMIAAQDPRSAFSSYFQQLQEEAFKPENDRIYSGLEYAMKMLDERKV